LGLDGRDQGDGEKGGANKNATKHAGPHGSSCIRDLFGEVGIDLIAAKR
jgi:hypothetical protein